MPYSLAKEKERRELRKQRYRDDPEYRAQVLARNKRWRDANPERQAASVKRWSEANLDARRASKRRYLDRNPGKSREAHLWRKHGLRTDQLADLWKSQGGCCYLCLEPLDFEEIHIDHDHRHCPKNSSCRLCRRGLAHSSCNVSIGHAGDDPAVLRRWADNLESARRAAAERIAASGTEQLTLDELAPHGQVTAY